MGEQWKVMLNGDDEEIWNELSKVIEPELGLSVVDLGLVDDIKIVEETLNVNFHLRMPDYPTALALFIAGDIKERLISLPGIVKVIVTLNDHMMSKQINRHINETV